MCLENTGRWTKATQKGPCSTSLAYSIPQETLLTWIISIAEVVRVFPRQCFLQKVPYEEETTGDLVLKIHPISSNWKLMRSTDFLFFSFEKWHPKALKCPWKYGGPAFHRHSQHTVLNGEMLCSCFLANPFRLPTFGSESPPELNGLFPITCTCH